MSEPSCALICLSSFGNFGPLNIILNKPDDMTDMTDNCKPGGGTTRFQHPSSPLTSNGGTTCNCLQLVVLAMSSSLGYINFRRNSIEKSFFHSCSSYWLLFQLNAKTAYLYHQFHCQLSFSKGYKKLCVVYQALS